MTLKIAIEPNWKARDGKVANDHRDFTELLGTCPRLCRRYNIESTSPYLGGGCTSVVVGTSPHRAIKVTSGPGGEEEAWAMHRLSKRGKIPHLVQSFGVLYLPEIELFVVRAERLHTNLYHYLRAHHNIHDAWDCRWEILDRRLVINEFKKRLRSVGLSERFTEDCHTANIMFDRRNRPTWFDFSCYGDRPTAEDLEQIPWWDEEKGRIVQPSKMRKAT